MSVSDRAEYLKRERRAETNAAHFFTRACRSGDVPLFYEAVMRRFTRLTNAFFKKCENHCHSLALYFVYCNWIRKHKAHGQTPAMAAGLTDKPMLMADLVEVLDEREQTAIYDRRQGHLSQSN